VRCLSIRYQIAQKLHACTEVFPLGRENDRFRDLIDLLLLRALDPDLTAIRHACDDIFASRAKHAWPPTLDAPSSWAEPYARLAGELEFAITDLDEAARLVSEFIGEIDEAVDITPALPRAGQTWRRDDGVRVEIQEADSTRLVVNQFDPTSGTTVVNAIDPRDVARMVLVADPNEPLWRVTVIGSFSGPAHAALLRVGEVAGASSLRVTRGELTGPMLDATIGARDEVTARALAKSVLPADATIVAVAKARAGT
jgi:Nucleotidyl transferase AbiEii toxin, Type IV TA system